MKTVITGFHAIEEKIRQADENSAKKMRLFVAKSGPRVKKIVQEAKTAKIQVENVDEKTLDSIVSNLSVQAQEHRGIVLKTEEAQAKNKIDLDDWIRSAKNLENATVLILDSITDPHNVGAILRSADQFGANLVVLPTKNAQNDVFQNEIVARASAGASAIVNVAVVPNLVRAAKNLKDAGFWIYGADANGDKIDEMAFAPKTAIVMGSEGSGIARLLFEECDKIVSIPTCGKIDSLNVSVAAGILLYERRRQSIAGTR